MSFETNIQNLATRVSTEAKSLRTMINGNQIGLGALDTIAKSSLVAAINELHAALESSGQIEVGPATESSAGVVELATTSEAVNGVQPSLAVTPVGLKAAIDDLRTSILGAGVPAALDTLDELAAALGDDANFAANLTNTLANKQPLDATLTALSNVVVAADQFIYATGPDTFAVGTVTSFGRSLLDDVDAASGRGTLSVYSKAEIGDINADFVATFEAGLI